MRKSALLQAAHFFFVFGYLLFAKSRVRCTRLQTRRLTH